MRSCRFRRRLTVTVRGSGSISYARGRDSTIIRRRAMAILIRIPASLQRFTKNQGEVYAEGVTVQETLDHLAQNFPGMREQLCDDHGAIRRFVNLYLNHEDIRFLDGEKTVVKDGDELAIIPAVAGDRKSTRLN